jgi:hypothetical protein
MAEPHNLFAIPCRSPGCNRWFRNNAGLTQHMRAKHFIAPIQQPERPGLAPDIPDPPEDVDAPAAPLGGEVPLQEDRQQAEWEYHPLLCGMYSLPIF